LPPQVNTKQIQQLLLTTTGWQPSRQVPESIGCAMREPVRKNRAQNALVRSERFPVALDQWFTANLCADNSKSSRVVRSSR
jgi:hypothetical protein